MEIIRGRLPGAKKTVIYGPEGIGKSTFASKFPDPVFIDTEGSTKDMDVARFPKASSWMMLMDQARHVKTHPEVCRTLVIDTADWAEMLCIEHILSKNQQTSIEGFGYGKGYTYVQEEFGRLLNLLEEVVGAGVHVVLTAHAKMRKFEQPDEMGAYDRWEMKLSKGVAPMVKEWADMVLFANYKTLVYNVDGQGAQKGKNKAQGGKRVMYTTHHPCWDAKNRYGLPDEAPFEYSVIANILEQKPAPKEVGDIHEEPQEKPVKPPAKETEYKSAADAAPSPKRAPDIPDGTQLPPLEQAETEGSMPFIPQVSKRVPKALRDLMAEYQVSDWDIEAAVAKKGYMPEGMKLEDYPEDFVMGCLVAAWPKVYEQIKEIQLEYEIPFN